ncbi:hypothetical protein [Stenotrophomonas sp. GZD-301]|uniref:hypothetical protein n=1 Tax=Stenotrophomonas sp. GZD-301 TaxID=3404814 RepID=UPI003BB6D966
MEKLYGLPRRAGERRAFHQARGRFMQVISRKCFSAASTVAVATLAVGIACGYASPPVKHNQCNIEEQRAGKAVCGTPLTRLIVAPSDFEGVRVETSGFMLYEGAKGVVFYPSDSLPNRTDAYSCIVVWSDSSKIDWSSPEPEHGVYFATVVGTVSLSDRRRTCSAELTGAEVSDISVVKLHE